MKYNLYSWQFRKGSNRLNNIFRRKNKDIVMDSICVSFFISWLSYIRWWNESTFFIDVNFWESLKEVLGMQVVVSEKSQHAILSWYLKDYTLQSMQFGIFSFIYIIINIRFTLNLIDILQFFRSILTSYQ